MTDNPNQHSDPEIGSDDTPVVEFISPSPTISLSSHDLEMNELRSMIGELITRVSWLESELRKMRGEI